MSMSPHSVSLINMKRFRLHWLSVSSLALSTLGATFSNSPAISSVRQKTTNLIRI